MSTKVDIQADQFKYNSWTYSFETSVHRERKGNAAYQSFDHPKDSALTLQEYLEYRDNV